jgi:UDP-3-O-[3-hydroxymyristoyl] N-acetylglucosamine deacetylase
MRNQIQLNQTTVRKDVRISGVGLHSGSAASIVIKPALPNTGILFVRQDLPEPMVIPALFDFVTQTRLATTLGRDGVSISTVEHLLCALKLVGIDNAMIEVDGPEVPIMDGSAEPFCAAILEAGIYVQNASKKVAVLKRRVEIRKGDKVAMIEPSHRSTPQLRIQAKIEWSHPAIGVQEFTYILGKSETSEISRARTFGFMKDAEALQKAGLALGGSLDNAVIMDEEKVLNPDGLRYADEFVRHKVLDAVGDFALAPLSILGDVTLVKAGHELHAELMQAVFSDPTCYEVTTLAELMTPAPTLADMTANWFTETLQNSY